PHRPDQRHRRTDRARLLLRCADPALAHRRHRGPKGVQAALTHRGSAASPWRRGGAMAPWHRSVTVATGWRDGTVAPQRHRGDGVARWHRGTAASPWRRGGAMAPWHRSVTVATGWRDGTVAPQRHRGARLSGRRFGFRDCRDGGSRRSSDFDAGAVRYPSAALSEARWRAFGPFDAHVGEPRIVSCAPIVSD